MKPAQQLGVESKNHKELVGLKALRHPQECAFGATRVSI